MARLRVLVRERAGGLLALSVVLSVLLRVPYFQHAFVFVDEAWWATASKLLVQGGRLYHDVLLDKNPPIFLFCAWLFDGLGVSTHAMHLGSLALVVAVSVLLFCLGSRFFAPSVGGMAAVLYAVGSTTYYTPRIIGLNTETLMVVFTTAAVYACLHGLVAGRAAGFAAAGFFASLAAVTKPVAVTEAVLLGLFLLPVSRDLVRTRLRALVLFASGYLGGLLLLGAYLAASGTLSRWWEQCIVYGMTYVRAIPPGQFAVKLVRALGGFAIVYAWLWMLVWQSRRWRPSDGAPYRLALGWIASALVGVVIGRRFYANYFIQVMPPLALVGAIGAVALWRNLHHASARRILRTAACALLASFSWFHGQTAAHWYFMMAPAEHERAPYWGICREDRATRVVAQHLKARTSPRDSIFVWGSKPQLYFLADRRLATTSMDFDVGDDFLPNAALPAVRAQTALELRRAAPRYIVDVQREARLDKFAPFRELVEERYRLETELHGVRLYRLAPAWDPSETDAAAQATTSLPGVEGGY